MREGCEKVFHAYVEASTALIRKQGMTAPETHGERAERLKKLREKRLVDTGTNAFTYLHKYAYYDSSILQPEVTEAMRKVEESIGYVRRKIAAR